MRNDERLAAEPALATQGLTGLFIVQEDAPSLSHNNIFFPASLCFQFLGQKEREKESWNLFFRGSPQVMESLFHSTESIQCVCACVCVPLTSFFLHSFTLH